MVLEEVTARDAADLLRLCDNPTWQTRHAHSAYIAAGLVLRYDANTEAFGEPGWRYALTEAGYNAVVKAATNANTVVLAEPIRPESESESEFKMPSLYDMLRALAACADPSYLHARHAHLTPLTEAGLIMQEWEGSPPGETWRWRLTYDATAALGHFLHASEGMKDAADETTPSVIGLGPAVPPVASDIPTPIPVMPSQGPGVREPGDPDEPRHDPERYLQMPLTLVRRVPVERPIDGSERWLWQLWAGTNRLAEVEAERHAVREAAMRLLREATTPPAHKMAYRPLPLED